MVKNRPTAVFSASDVMAIGAMNCALDHNFEVPKDISFMGFDNIDMASVVRPQLTTVDQPATLIGQKALNILLDQMAGKNVKSEIIVGHKIIQGGSCGAYGSGL